MAPCQRHGMGPRLNTMHRYFRRWKIIIVSLLLAIYTNHYIFIRGRCHSQLWQRYGWNAGVVCHRLRFRCWFASNNLFTTIRWLCCFHSFHLIACCLTEFYRSLAGCCWLRQSGFFVAILIASLHRWWWCVASCCLALVGVAICDELQSLVFGWFDSSDFVKKTHMDIMYPHVRLFMSKMGPVIWYWDFSPIYGVLLLIFTL